MPRSFWSVRVGLAVVVTVAAGSVAGPAAAASYGWATADSTNVTFTADYGVKNQIVVTRSGRTVTIDDRVAVKPGKGCKQVKGDKTRVRCTTGKAPTKVVVDLYDRNDSVVNNSDLKMEADGGDGNDKLVGGSKADDLRGDSVCARVHAGSDKVYGRGGNDQIYGDDGADYISAGDGNDWVFGDSDCVDGPNRSGNDVPTSHDRGPSCVHIAGLSDSVIFAFRVFIGHAIQRWWRGRAAGPRAPGTATT